MHFANCSTVTRAWTALSRSTGANPAPLPAECRALPDSAHRLSREKYDLTIDLQGLLRSGLMTAATRAKIRVGLSDAREGSRWFYTHVVEAPRRQMHAVDRVLRVASALGLEPFEPAFEICPTDQDRRWAAEILAPVPTRA